MLVYRFEGDDLRGPYCECYYKEKGERLRGRLAEELCESHRDDAHPPTGIDIEWSDWALGAEQRSCFASIRSAESWFAGYLGRLKDAGYTLSVYELDEEFWRAGRSRLQSIFDPESAEKIGEVDYGEEGIGEMRRLEVADDRGCRAAAG